MLVLSTFLESKTVPNVVPFAGLILVQTLTTKDRKGLPLFREKTVFIKTQKTAIKRPVDHTGET